MMEVINFGKHRGKTWDEISQSCPGYIEWARKEGLRQLPARFRNGAALGAVSMQPFIYSACNAEQQAIVDHLKAGRNVVAPGIPGSGKSYVAKNLAGKIVALAPTGVASINIGGSTFHAHFRINPNDLLLTVGNNVDCPDGALWILDEVFYTSASMLYRILTYILEHTRNSQFLLLGDPMQLKPVERRGASSTGDTEYDAAEKANIIELKEWKGKTVFDVLEFLGISFELVKLVKSVRHKELATFEFMKAARCASLTKEQLQSLLVTSNPPTQCVTLAYSNEMVDRLNREGLNQFKKIVGIDIIKEAKNAAGEEVTVEMINDSDTNQGHKTLLLKKLKYYSRNFAAPLTAVGAQIMVTKNIRVDGKFVAVNGDTGQLMQLSNSQAVVRLDRTKALITISRTFTGYTSRDGVWKIGVTIIPIRTCYAATVHKSQGMTISSSLHIIIDPGMIKKPGLLYTAVTRSEDINKVTVSKQVSNRHFSYDKKWFAKFENL